MIGHGIRCSIEPGGVDGGTVLGTPVGGAQMAVGAGGDHGVRARFRLGVELIAGLEILVGLAKRRQLTKARQQGQGAAGCGDATVDVADQRIPGPGQQRTIIGTCVYDRRRGQHPGQAPYVLRPYCP